MVTNYILFFCFSFEILCLHLKVRWSLWTPTVLCEGGDKFRKLPLNHIHTITNVVMFSSTCVPTTFAQDCNTLYGSMHWLEFSVLMAKETTNQHLTHFNLSTSQLLPSLLSHLKVSLWSKEKRPRSPAEWLDVQDHQSYGRVLTAPSCFLITEPWWRRTKMELWR